jgi:hypothetical protein
MSILELSYEDLTTNQVCSVFVFIILCVNVDAVYAIYDVEVRIIDRVKKAALSQMLLESITLMEPGEKLNKKFANFVLPADARQCMNLIKLHSSSH